MKRLALALVIFAAGAVATGATYQAVGVLRDKHRFPEQGRPVQAGSVRLNLDCSGEHTSRRPAAVILDSGMGVPAIGWSKVQPEVAKFARVCSYDRAGYGWSDAGPEPRTSIQIAKELKTLLNTAGENGPYVLVGHSFGGFNVRVFTKLYPTDVIGVVLVDGSHEDEAKRINEMLPVDVVERETRDDQQSAKMNQFLMPFRVYLGIQRLQVVVLPSKLDSQSLRI